MNEPSVPALSRPQSVLNRVFQGPRGLRSGWRLILFLLFFVGIQYVLDNTLIHRLVALGLIKPIADAVLTPVAVLAEDGVDLIALMVAMAVISAAAKQVGGDLYTLFKIDVDDPSLYHLTLNTACVSLEGAAQIIAEVAQHFFQRQP